NKKKKKKIPKDSIVVIKETNPTFYIPINFLKKELKHTVASAYLILRAIDEIEDHEEIDNDLKYTILMEVSELFKQPFDEEKYLEILQPVKSFMPEVTLRLGEVVDACPNKTKKKVLDSFSEMAFEVEKWAKANWNIHTREDLDDYTYYVAGLVGVML